MSWRARQLHALRRHASHCALPLPTDWPMRPLHVFGVGRDGELDEVAVRAQVLAALTLTLTLILTLTLTLTLTLILTLTLTLTRCSPPCARCCCGCPSRRRAGCRGRACCAACCRSSSSPPRPGATRR